MHDPHPSDTGAAKAVSQLGESLRGSLAQTAQSQRALFQEMTVFAKDESLRFANLRLERNGAALDKLQHCQGVPGLLSVQQEWLRDLMQDYMGQQKRLAGAFRGLTQNALASAAEAASDNIDRMQQNASEMVHRGSEQMDQAVHQATDMAQQTAEQVNQAAQDANHYVQEPVH
ncbi:MAG: hypothetical protein H0U98_15555 [Alphaproteobacteria bacterium]|nr:hypothetical protein [Alphaproteobacteria bacterium]